MAFNMVRFADLPPVSARGAVATEAKVYIRENGQISFNSKAITDFITPKGHENVAVFVDGQPNTFPQTWAIVQVDEATAEKIIKGGGTVYKLSHGKNEKTKGKQVYFSGTRLLKGYGYDYIASGNQGFSLKEEQITIAKNKVTAMLFTLSAASLTPAPKTPRKAKEKVAGGTQKEVATGQPVNGVVVAPADVPVIPATVPGEFELSM